MARPQPMSGAPVSVSSLSRDPLGQMRLQKVAAVVCRSLWVSGGDGGVRINMAARYRRFRGALRSRGFLISCHHDRARFHRDLRSERRDTTQAVTEGVSFNAS